VLLGLPLALVKGFTQFACLESENFDLPRVDGALSGELVGLDACAPAQPPRPGGCCPGRILLGALNGARLAARARSRPVSVHPGISFSSAPA
jgi:hypothetical protein